MSYIPPPTNPGASSFDRAQQGLNEQQQEKLAEHYSAVHGDEVRRPGLFTRLLTRVRGLRTPDQR